MLEDINDEVSTAFTASEIHAGLAHALRHRLDSYRHQLVVNDPQVAPMRHELFTCTLRTTGQETLAPWQIEGYTRIVAEWCQQAASNAGEVWPGSTPCPLAYQRLADAHRVEVRPEFRD